MDTKQQKEVKQLCDSIQSNIERLLDIVKEDESVVEESDFPYVLYDSLDNYHNTGGNED